MSIHKVCFDAYLQFWIVELTSSHQQFDHDLIESLINLRCEPSADTLQYVLKLNSFDDILKKAIEAEPRTYTTGQKKVYILNFSIENPIRLTSRGRL